MLDRQKGAIQVHGLLAAPAFERQGCQVAADADPRRMDERVEPAELAPGLRDGGHPVLSVGHIHRARRGHPRAIGGGGQGWAVDLAPDHPGTFCGHDMRAGTTDAARDRTRTSLHSSPNTAHRRPDSSGKIKPTY